MVNRLAAALSPYLRQHAENPVDWWEWSPEAFEEAVRRDVPLLLSVGYARPDTGATSLLGWRLLADSDETAGQSGCSGSC